MPTQLKSNCYAVVIRIAALVSSLGTQMPLIYKGTLWLKVSYLRSCFNLCSIWGFFYVIFLFLWKLGLTILCLSFLSGTRKIICSKLLI